MNIVKYPTFIHFLPYKLSSFSNPPNSEKYISFRVEDNTNAFQTVYSKGWKDKLKHNEDIGIQTITVDSEGAELEISTGF